MPGRQHSGRRRPPTRQAGSSPSPISPNLPAMHPRDPLHTSPNHPYRPHTARGRPVRRMQDHRPASTGAPSACPGAVSLRAAPRFGRAGWPKPEETRARTPELASLGGWAARCYCRQSALVTGPRPRTPYRRGLKRPRTEDAESPVAYAGAWRRPLKKAVPEPVSLSFNPSWPSSSPSASSCPRLPAALRRLRSRGEHRCPTRAGGWGACVKRKRFCVSCAGWGGQL